MKICYINPTFLIRRPIANLIDLLGDRHEIGIFVPKKPFQKVDKSWHSNKSLRKARVYSYSAVNIPFIDFEWPIPISPMFLINLFRVFLRYKVIHIWTYFYVNTWFILFFRLLMRKQLIMSVDTFPGYSMSSGKLVDSLFYIYNKLFSWFLFSVPDKIHLYGKSLIKHARKHKIKRKKIIVLSTGINLSKFQGKFNDLRKEFDIKKDDLVLVYAGLIVPRKGIDVMLKVVKNLKNKKVKLLLVGEGPTKENYIDLTRKLGIADQVVFKTWRTDIPSVLKNSDILFLPSRGEGLPGIVMEAMACGLPVVASRIPCIPDLVDNGKTGFLCEIDDVKNFVRKMDILVKNNKVKKKMGQAGKKKIKQLEWKTIINKYKVMYKN